VLSALYWAATAATGGFGIVLAPSASFREDNGMFAISAVLIGVIGIFYVRRRSARKKTAPAR